MARLQDLDPSRDVRAMNDRVMWERYPTANGLGHWIADGFGSYSNAWRVMWERYPTANGLEHWIADGFGSYSNAWRVMWERYPTANGFG